ncbi:hypothetical protein [Sphingobium ummariense]
MLIQVGFPDGSARDVPAQLRSISTPASGGPPTMFELVPLQCNALWQFVRSEKGWQAVGRRQLVTKLGPPAQEWWHSIVQMRDEADVPLRQACRIGKASQRQSL